MLMFTTKYDLELIAGIKRCEFLLPEGMLNTFEGILEAAKFFYLDTSYKDIKISPVVSQVSGFVTLTTTYTVKPNILLMMLKWTTFEVNGNGWIVLRNKSPMTVHVNIHSAKVFDSSGETINLNVGDIVLKHPDFGGNGKSVFPIKKSDWSDEGGCIIDYTLTSDFDSGESVRATKVVFFKDRPKRRVKN